MLDLHIYWFNTDVPPVFKRIATRSIVYKVDMESDSIIDRFKKDKLIILFIHLN